MRRIVLAAVVLAAVLPATAGACSCAGPGDPRAELAASDGALFGKVVRRTETGSTRFGQEVKFRLKVLRDYKDNLGRHFALKTSASGASCGLEVDTGDRVGLLLNRFRGELTSSLCGQRTRAHLEAGLEPLPKPTGDAPTTLLLGGAFGGPRTFGLDAGGRIVGYGDGAGTVQRFAPCPGGDVVVELLLNDRSRWQVAARTVSGFAVSEPVTLDVRRYIEDVECLDAEGSASAVLTEPGRVLKVDGSEQTTLGTGFQRATLAGGRAFGRESVIDLLTGTTEPFGPLPERAEPLALSPDGQTLAVGGGRKELLLVDAQSAAIQERDRSYGYEAIWLSDDALVVSSYRRQRFFDRELNVADKGPRLFSARTADGGELVVVRGDQLVRFDAQGRRVGRPVRLFSPDVRAICALTLDGP